MVENSTFLTRHDNAPALPPSMTEFHNKSANEILSQLNKMPLFMTTIEDNDDVQALRALAYEGSPYEVANNFKNNGNECYAKKKYADAKKFYEKSIDVLTIEARKQDHGEQSNSSTEQEKKKDALLLEICLVNRAACHLELQNYRMCIQDCGRALQLNIRNIKAYYRSCRALLALDKIAEAKDTCECALAIDSENNSLRSVAAAISHKTSVLAAREKENYERAQRRLLESKTLKAALLARSVTLRTTTEPPDMENIHISLVPDSMDPMSTLCFPTLFLYPIDLQSDLIKAFNETHCISDQLEYMLPLPWDSECNYTLQGVECYIETTTGNLIKVGKRVPLLRVLARNDVVVFDQLVKLYLVPKTNAASWVSDFKEKKIHKF